MKRRVAVFASGGGTNLQALLDDANAPSSCRPAVTLVVSDRADAGAIARAKQAGVPAVVIPVTGRSDGDVADAQLTALKQADIDIVALAGYVKLVPATVVRAFRGRIINVHPALLPAFGGHGMYGTRVHRAVLEAGCRITGVTVHEVDEQYDRGRPIAQWPVPVLPGDSPESLAARVLRIEHVLYPLAVELVASRLDREAAGEATIEARPDEPLAGPSFGLIEDDAALATQMRRMLGLNRE